MNYTLKNNLRINETQLLQQINSFNEQGTILETIQNKFDCLQNQFTSQQERISKFIQDENIAIEQIKLINNQKISSIENNYITKKKLKSAVAAAKEWSAEREKCPYHLAYQAILYTFSKVDEAI